MATITLTFGDRAENHASMQIIGDSATEGLNKQDLKQIKLFFEERGFKCKMVKLNKLLPSEIKAEKAYLLIVKKGVNCFVNSEELSDEQKTLDRDTKFLNKGKVCNKKARHNLCFSDFSQEPDYSEGKGRVYNFSELDSLRKLRDGISSLNEKLNNLQAEGNYYYDISQTYIGMHNDLERKIVVACRLGAKFPLHFHWFYRFKPVGELFSYELKNGDMYFMSSKAVGTDGRKSSIYTLRHAAGFLDVLNKYGKHKF